MLHIIFYVYFCSKKSFELNAFLYLLFYITFEYIYILLRFLILCNIISGSCYILK